MNGSNKLSSPKEEKVEELPMKTPFADFFGNVVANEEKEKEEDCGPIKKKKKRSIEEMLFDDIKDQATIGNDGKQEPCDPEEKECEEEDEKQCCEEEESNRNRPDTEVGEEQMQSCVLCGKEAFWACDSGKWDTDKNDDLLHDWNEMKRMLLSDKKEKKDSEDDQENKNTEDDQEKKDSEEQEEEKKNTESEQEKKDSEDQKEEKDSEDQKEEKDSEDQKEEKDSEDQKEEKDSEDQKEEKDSEDQKEEEDSEEEEEDSDDEQDKEITEAEEDDEEEKKRKEEEEKRRREEEEKRRREEEKIALSLLRKDFMSLVFMLGRMEKMSFCEAHRVKWEKKIKEEEEKGLQMAFDAGSMGVSESATLSISNKEGTLGCGMSKEEEKNRWIELKARYKKLIEFKEPSTSNQDEKK